MSDPEIVSKAEEALLEARQLAPSRPDDAQSLFHRAISLDPSNAIYRLVYAEFLARQGQAQWANARDQLHRALRVDAALASAWLASQEQARPDDVALLLLSALRWCERGDTANAASVVDKLAALAPQAAAWVKDTTAQQVKDNGASAIPLTASGQADLRDAQEPVAPPDAPPPVVKPTEAEKARRLVSLARLRLEQGEDLESDDLDEGNPRSVAGRLREALDLDPTYAPAHYWRYRLLRLQGDWCQAASSLDRAALAEGVVSPTEREEFQAQFGDRQREVKALIGLARETADDKQAADALTQALKLMRDDPDLHLAYAERLWPTEPQQAEEHIRLALKADPDHLGANRRWIELLRARGDEQAARRWEGQVRDRLPRLFQERPDDIGIAEAYLDALLAEAKWNAAAEVAVEALDRHPNHAGLAIRRALALKEQGALLAARRTFETALAQRSLWPAAQDAYEATLRQIALAEWRKDQARLDEYQGDTASAAARLRQALEMVHDDAEARLWLERLEAEPPPPPPPPPVKPTPPVELTPVAPPVPVEPPSPPPPPPWWRRLLKFFGIA